MRLFTIMNLYFEIVILCQILTFRSCDVTQQNLITPSENLKPAFKIGHTDARVKSGQLIPENVQRSSPSSHSFFIQRRLLKYDAGKKQSLTNCGTENYGNTKLDVLDNRNEKTTRCTHVAVNSTFEGIISVDSKHDNLSGIRDKFGKATSDIFRFFSNNSRNDLLTVENYGHFSKKGPSTPTSGKTGFIRNTSISRQRDLTDEVEYIRKKRDVGEANVIVVGQLDADSISDVYAYLHVYLKILVDMKNVTVVSNDSNMVLNAQELCTKTWNEYFKNIKDESQLYCNSSWDNFSCWPRTPAGSTATIRCPSYLAEINKSQNATKHCNENGTWADRAVYDLCIETEKDSSADTSTTDSEAVRIIYNIGFSVSTLTLAIALFIFLYFRSLRCLRNSIHCHLIITFIIKNIVWIIMWHSLVYMQASSCTWCCKALTTIFNFAHATNFFWMFVEGLYLHIIIVWTYSADKIKLQYLLLIGWGLPSVNITAWVIVKLVHETKQDVCWLPRDDGNSIYDYIYIGPILFVLFANIIFLSTIVWVLITKLRASHTLETRQYRKAVKATIILFPLLGIIYVIFITPPSDHPRVHLIFTYINAVLQSFQGLLVAVFYCFLNGEVKSVLKKKLSRFNDARSLSTKYTRTSYNWTRNSRDFGNTITLGNGALTESARSPGVEAKDTPECIPLTDSQHADKQHNEHYWNLK